MTSSFIRSTRRLALLLGIAFGAGCGGTSDSTAGTGGGTGGSTSSTGTGTSGSTSSTGTGTSGSTSGTGGGAHCASAASPSACALCCANAYGKGISLVDYDCACGPGAPCAAACGQSWICGPSSDPSDACVVCFEKTLAPGASCASDQTFSKGCSKSSPCGELAACLAACPSN